MVSQDVQDIIDALKVRIDALEVRKQAAIVEKDWVRAGDLSRFQDGMETALGIIYRTLRIRTG